VVGEVLGRMGGVATRAALIAATSRAEVDAALAAGDVVAVARGRYALPSADDALVAAHRLCGLVSHFSAAVLHGWQVRLPPELPHVTVPRSRTVDAEQRRGVELHRTTLGPDDRDCAMTSKDRTLLDCMRAGDFIAGLCVADSALRDGMTPRHLWAIARDARGPGSAQVRRIAKLADGRAANAFESALRGIAIDVPGLNVVPQVSLYGTSGFLGRPDLVDDRLGIIVEAESFEWHGDQAALYRDAKRFNRFVINGWLVLRFTWPEVMFHPRQVEVILQAAVDERTERCSRCRAAA
jgi:hypothetical protein